MKVRELAYELSLLNPNYDITVKVGDKDRDLITKIGKVFCVNPDSNSGFVELETCNKIDWKRNEVII